MRLIKCFCLFFSCRRHRVRAEVLQMGGGVTKRTSSIILYMTGSASSKCAERDCKTSYQPLFCHLPSTMEQELPFVVCRFPGSSQPSTCQRRQRSAPIVTVPSSAVEPPLTFQLLCSVSLLYGEEHVKLCPGGPRPWRTWRRWAFEDRSWWACACWQPKKKPGEPLDESVKENGDGRLLESNRRYQLDLSGLNGPVSLS